jgi:hypothetical protein
MNAHDEFLTAIKEKKKVKLKFNSIEKGVIERVCVPFDFGPSRREKIKRNRYHFYDLDSPEGDHTLSIVPQQLIEIHMLAEVFNPGDYVTWSDINWHTPRDWGKFS